ncbi:hypothetical protein N665_0294s0036 [Sinapis alba]|nr:hypothetical protein N665_0294s0036 [Sinapis alba]
MASSSEKANLLGKRKPEDGLGTEPVLKKEIEARETVETEPIQEPYKKTLFVSHLPAYTKISDIICFFQNVGQVVRVRLIVNNCDKFTGDALVEFASADQANKALKEKKYDKFLNWRNIFLDVANNKGAPLILPPKYCIDHKVWYQEDEDHLQQVEEGENYLQQVEEDEEYLQQESLPIEEDETRSNTEEDSVLLIANLSPQTIKVSHINRFFSDVGNIVSVRLIVDNQHKHVGYAFIEFASAKQANWALENKNGEYLNDHKILLMKRHEDTPHSAETVITVRDKTLFVDNLSKNTTISDIINFFKDVGEVVHVRLIVGQRTGTTRIGYVEFASATEAEKVMEKKNGEYLKKRPIYLAFVKEAAKPSRTKYCIDHKVWYEGYPQGESNAAVEGLNETPDFVEEVSSRTKTVFVVDKKNVLINIPNIIRFFEDVEEVATVRRIVDHWGRSVGCCYVEFASGNKAKQVQKKKKGNGVYVKMAEITPYPFRPKYNLTDLAEKLWYEDKLRLRREGFGLPTKSKLKKDEAISCGQEEASSCGQEITFCGQKITFSEED